jgi:hypothetical protein
MRHPVLAIQIRTLHSTPHVHRSWLVQPCRGKDLYTPGTNSTKDLKCGTGLKNWRRNHLYNGTHGATTFDYSRIQLPTEVHMHALQRPTTPTSGDAAMAHEGCLWRWLLICPVRRARLVCSGMLWNTTEQTPCCNWVRSNNARQTRSSSTTVRQRRDTQPACSSVAPST